MILVSALSIPNLAHCKTLKRDGNVMSLMWRLLVVVVDHGFSLCKVCLKSKAFVYSDSF